MLGYIAGWIDGYRSLAGVFALPLFLLWRRGK